MKQKKAGSTFNAHRLLKYAEKYEKRKELLLSLYENYFEKHQSISDINVLCEIAQSLGIQVLIIRKQTLTRNQQKMIL